MGRVGVVQSVATVTDDGENTTEVKIDIGGADGITPESFGASGVDAPPLEDDYALVVETPGGSGYAVAGYLDGKNAGVAVKGEYRVVGRDPSGTIKNTFWMKADGSVRLENDKGYAELGADGTVDLNGNFTVDP